MGYERFSSKMFLVLVEKRMDPDPSFVKVRIRIGE